VGIDFGTGATGIAFWNGLLRVCAPDACGLSQLSTLASHGSILSGRQAGISRVHSTGYVTG
jgi:hypothetical protein